MGYVRVVIIHRLIALVVTNGFTYRLRLAFFLNYAFYLNKYG